MLMLLAIALGFYGYTVPLDSYSVILDLALFATSIAFGLCAAAPELALIVLAAFSARSFIGCDIRRFQPPS
ncbi:MAG: hypothetical protein ACKVS5_02380 [Parvularculaceae bacterium]